MNNESTLQVGHLAHNKNFFQAFLFLSIVLLVGCTPNPRYRIRYEIVPPKDKSKPLEFSNESSDRIIAVVNDFLGTPYKIGGTDKNGMDCSGFVSAVFSNSISMQLPRSTSEMWKLGWSIEKKNLKIGDLVFFRTGTSKNPDHIGIYVGNGKFTHASRSKGVVVTDMSDKYWRSKYFGSKRILRHNR